MRRAVAFTFRMGQKLTQILISSGALNINKEAGTTGAQEQRSKEHSERKEKKTL